MGKLDFFFRSRAFKILRLQSKGGALQQLGYLDIDVPNLKYSGPKPVPWFCYGSIDFIEHQVSPSSKVLELGGGGSTLFWTARGNSVVTVETDSDWATLLRNKISDPRWELIPALSIQPSAPELEQLGVFDVIINDFAGPRHEMLDWIIKHLADDGFIIWDNSDREESSEIFEILALQGFGRIAFFGLGPMNPYAWETSVFSRRLVTSNWHIPDKAYVDY